MDRGKIGEFSVVCGVGSNMVGDMEAVGEEWGSVLGCG